MPVIARDANGQEIQPGMKVRFVGTVESVHNEGMAGVRVRAARSPGYEIVLMMPPSVLEVTEK